MKKTIYDLEKVCWYLLDFLIKIKAVKEDMDRDVTWVLSACTSLSDVKKEVS